MTFEEWFDNDCKSGNAYMRSRGSLKEYAREIWDAATEEVKKDHFKLDIDWESRPWAVEVRIGYCTKQMKESLPTTIGERILTIPRPEPAFEPKDGEPVFVRDDNLQVSVARVRELATNGRCVLVFTDGEVCRWKVEDLKPFDPDKIGKPWDEV